MEFPGNKELLQFFHRHKTDLSCMENPHTFLTKIRDYDLIPEDRYEKLRRMKSKESLRRGLYDTLDWLEKELSEDISVFWRCVFMEPILHFYPTLQRLHKSLLDGSFHFESRLPQRVEMKERDDGKRKKLPEDELKQTNSVKKKKKKKQRRRRRSDDDDEDGDDDEEQPGPSSQMSLRKKTKKISFSSPLKKGEKGDIWTWPLYQSQLPVTCGSMEGTLQRDRLAKGEKCILVKKQWFTPTEFEKFSGKEHCKNWKVSIRCHGTVLGKLIEEGHLKAANYKKRSKKAKKSLFPSSSSATETEREETEEEVNQEDQAPSNDKEMDTDEDEEMEDQTEQQPGSSQDSRKVLKVTCGSAAGTLHIRRFASGTCGKSIRTETSWLTPMEFTKEASCQTDASWRKDIKCEGEALSALIEAKILRIHSLLCTCRLCQPDTNDLENQRNDDECCICKSGGEEEEDLVVCDHCPRSFHPRCHLPQIDDSVLRDDSPWMCTFCVFKTNQEFLYSDQLETESVMSRPISPNILECQYLLLCLCNADEEQIFATNPTVYLENYSAFIRTPMWLGFIADKLQRTQYHTVGQFVSDVRLIFQNCAAYNQSNAEFLAMGEELNQLFDEEFKKAFNIQD
ncbi:nuclear body protein SP140-like protein isoform X2 [Acanthochromis polyacanthus]|uniref:nuclear body protein SP140-like protein isoform X2 n=1 Tax=Acanthochromis polyacanthus TaxID=80966 RepID=UPI002234A959|nr:nuclear body protein SP140-like protein isoform X2 [Acanthochromis polyacanthus]